MRLLMLACLHVGVPISPVSPGNSLLSKDFAKLRANGRAAAPGRHLRRRHRALHAGARAVADLHDAVVVAGSRSMPSPGTIPFAGIAGAGADDTAVKAAFNALTPDTIAKFLFTRVPSARRRRSSRRSAYVLHVEMKSVIWPFLNKQKPVIVDWLPWSHVFGGSHNFNKVVRFGGSLYIDDGKPVPALLPKTVKNLTDVAPTILLQRAACLGMLVARLRDDADLRRSFFSRCRSSSMPARRCRSRPLDELERLAVMELGHPVVMLSSWGSTETAPACTDATSRRCGSA